MSAISSLRGIKETEDGLEIGALTTLSEIGGDLKIQRSYSLLSKAAEVVASPQIRNIGTIGGNISQDVRCWYYRRGLSCYRAGGNLCYADTPEGMNREHALFETSRCVAASASDTAPALVALNATMVIKSTQGERMLSAEDYFVGPSIDIQNTTALRPGEVLTAVRLPTDWANASFYYEKVSDRNVWDFSLVNVAAAFKLDNEIIQDSRIVCGAVQCTPRRIVNVENAIRGQVKSQKTADLVSDSATAGAKALAHNGFKVPLMRNLVKRAIAA